MIFTVFPRRSGRTKIEHVTTWAALCAMLADPPTYPSKEECPWLSLARYGDVFSDRGSLKHAANVLGVYGVEADYDGERVSIDHAAHMARAAGLKACLYTSPSHRPDAPRWRILVPLARVYPIDARESFVDRLNGILGGLLSAESWNRAQGFTFGRVVGRDYQCLTTE